MYVSDFNLTFQIENIFYSNGGEVVIEFQTSETSQTEFALVSDQICTVTSETIFISADVIC